MEKRNVHDPEIRFPKDWQQTGWPDYNNNNKVEECTTQKNKSKKSSNSKRKV